MKTYIIEGIVSEIYVDASDNFSFKLNGTEGYCIKHDNNRFNLLCPENFENELNTDSETHLPCFILSKDYQFTVSEKNKILVIQNSGAGRRVRLCIKIEDNVKLSKLFSEKSKPVKPSSLTLLSD